MGKGIVLVTLVIAAVVAAPNYAALFEQFKTKHGRTYASAAEEAKRLRVFEENMKTAAKHQATNPHATFGANEFSDMSAQEFKIRHNAEKFYAAKKAGAKAVPALFTAEQVKKAAGGSIDWRTKGAVTYVKNQGNCGSCWSFSSTGSIEAQWFLAGNTLVALSEQELVSCDTSDSGCGGGEMDSAWAWLVSSQSGAIATEASYPYVSGDGQVPSCSLPATTGATISGHKDLPQNEDQMATWMLTGGPISIGVDASSWQSYTGGILSDCTSQTVDHGVLAVGFDDNNSPPYWIIKNSWGASWGESGYIRVEKGTDQCLITSGPCSSVVSGGPGPQPPTPPGPTPPPSPPSGDFTQYVCNDWQCTEGCQSNSFPQNSCLQDGGGGSVIVQCTSQGLQTDSYSSSDCSGSYQSQVEPLDQCLQDTSGTYVYNVCPSGKGLDGATTRGTKFQLTKALREKRNRA